MGAVFKREVSSYFTSAIGYVFFAIFLVFSGVFFVLSNLYYKTADMSSFYQSMLIVYMFIIPILTMRLFSEDKRQKTDQALLTAPVSLTGVVMGKFFAAFLIFAAAICSTLINALILASFGTIETGVVFGSVLGMLLLGAAFIGIGMFISSMTENQVIAAVASFAIILFLIVLDSFSSIVSNKIITGALTMISVNTRYNHFAVGNINISDGVYFASIAVVFIFLTIRILEKRRWS